jgi:hypothetical protein
VTGTTSWVCQYLTPDQRAAAAAVETAHAACNTAYYAQWHGNSMSRFSHRHTNRGTVKLLLQHSHHELLAAAMIPVVR